MGATDIALSSTVKPPTGAQSVPNGIAGEAFSAGAALYRKAADGKLYKAIGNSVLENATVIGIALAASAGADQIIPYFTGGGDLSNVSGLIVGEAYFISNATAGSLMKYSDVATTNFVTLVGIAKTAAIFSVHIFSNGIAHA